MSKIVFFSIPAHGHTNPTLGVVKELVSRGHEVWYYSFDMFREKIEATGATFISCDEYHGEKPLSPQEAARVGKDLVLSTRLLVDTTLAMDDMVCAHMERLKPDCIVGDSMAVWGKAVAVKLDIPFVCSTTTFAFNRYSAKIMKKSPKELVRMLLAAPKTAKEVERLRRKGYRVKSVLDLLGSDDKAHTIVYTSPEFQPAADTFSDKFAFVGPSIRPAESVFEKTRETLVYISMGTVNNDLLSLYQNCISGLKNMPYQVVLSVGDSVPVEAFGTLPEHICVFRYVDQIAVLEQADVFVSHCGMNSVSESLYFGVPLVMLPQTAEQGGVAERVSQLGAGRKLETSDARSLLDGIQQVLTDPAYKKQAAAIGESFKQCPGAQGAADKIIQVCQG